VPGGGLAEHVVLDERLVRWRCLTGFVEARALRNGRHARALQAGVAARREAISYEGSEGQATWCRGGPNNDEDTQAAASPVGKAKAQSKRRGGPWLPVSGLRGWKERQA